MFLYRSNRKMKGERLTVKGFKFRDDAYAFLAKQPNNDWKELPETICGMPIQQKAGTYASAGGKWHNVKSLDPSVLAHI